MPQEDKVNILLVDDHPAKLLSYEVILRGLGENLVKVTSGREALDQLLKIDVAVVLMDVSMPDLDGFQLAAMIRDHPRFKETAIIFVSAIHLSEGDYIRGYEMGAVDYVPVPVVPEILRAKVKVFAELYRKTRQLEALNNELEKRVAERTAELKASTERQSILAREVDHRAKNALAVVQSIVRLTSADDIESYVAAVEGRITSLSRAHALLSDARWEGANLATLIEEELAPYRGGNGERIVALGPNIVLQPASAQAIALAVHELATNAAKHGALSSTAGRLKLTWDLQPDLTIDWEESGGPETRRPRVQGFGTKVITASVEGQLGGRSTFNWRPEGLHCTLTIPSRRAARAPVIHFSDTVSVAGRKVLLVEDEPLVSMMMADALSKLGYTVVGPCARLADAMAAIGDGQFEVAVLDVNLGGELVFPVADILTDLRTPFIFVTGGPERIDQRFAHVPVLQKPIQIDALESAFSTALLADIGRNTPAARRLSTTV
jgi:two-component sensor histidine kinase/two-component SAPR family response regulator